VEQVDVIAGYLRQLQQAGVPGLFRPYHEMNGNWFWWGGRPGEKGSAALYRQIYDRFVNVHHLNNLIWVWNVNSPSENAGSITRYYPGPRYADIVTMDIYGEFKQGYYNDMVGVAGDKPIALGEVGAMPSVDVLANQPRWTYFMMWSGLAETANSPEQLRRIFHAPNLLNRGDSPFTATSAPIVMSVAPVTPNALPQVKAILGRLYDAVGTHVLSGQENDASAVEVATQEVFQVTSKYPAIYGADLDTTPGASSSIQSVVDEAIRQSLDKALVSLRWLAPNPTEPDGAAKQPASHEDPQRLLTDYEWKELLTPGSLLNQRWCAQVDVAADALRQLADKGVATLWTPYPEPNTKQYWWAGRSGIHGSAALYRMLFDRLVNHNHLQNLLWVWEGAPPGFGPGGNGPYSGYFPGLLYADALALRVSHTESRFSSDVFLRSFAVGKVIGLSIDGPAPTPAFFAKETNWAWFLLASEPAPADNAGAGAAATSTQALQTLYSDPHIISR
jgi:beta-mannanase